MASCEERCWKRRPPDASYGVLAETSCRSRPERGASSRPNSPDHHSVSRPSVDLRSRPAVGYSMYTRSMREATAERLAAVLVAISNAREGELVAMKQMTLERRRELGVGLSGAEARPYADGWLQRRIGCTGAPTVREGNAIPIGTSVTTRSAGRRRSTSKRRRPGGGAGKQARGGVRHDAEVGLVAAVSGMPLGPQEGGRCWSLLYNAGQEDGDTRLRFMACVH